MQKFLAVYLVATGIAASIALAMPSLVVLGFFLLIIPGLFLSLAPTAFLWGCIFAAVWWLCRTFMGDILAVVPAVAATAAILFAIPTASRLAGQKLFESSILPDVTPSAPIRPAGHVRLELPGPRWDNKNPPVNENVRAFSCDNLCVALLFAPGVTSLTVNASGAFAPEEHREGRGGLAVSARTYRLVPKAQCGDHAIEPDLEGAVGLFGKDLEENRKIDAEWNLKLASEYCIVAEPPVAAYDMLIRQGRYDYPEGEASAGRWSLAASPAQVGYVEIRDGSGKILLRQLISRVSVLARPFWISGTGGIESFRFGWGRQQLSSAGRHADVDLRKVLATKTRLGRPSPAADLIPQIRSRLKAAVANPALPAEDRSFATMEAYFGAIKSNRLSDEDLALVIALVLDERITNYPGLWELYDVTADQHRRIDAAIVRRLRATPDPLALRNAVLSNFLAKSPAGAFATLSEEERGLLASAERRVAAGGLIARLSDGGTGSVPLLLEILRYHGATLTALRESREKAPDHSQRFQAQAGAVDAARSALCRLGPAAAPALPQIERMIADGVIPAFMLEGHGGTDWNLMLLRLGKPLETIRKPERLSGTEANYRRNMENRLRRFDPQRSCGRL